MKKPAAKTPARKAVATKSPARKVAAKAPARKVAAKSAPAARKGVPAAKKAPARTSVPARKTAAGARPAAKKAATGRKQPATWKAPGDYKPALYQVDFQTEKDGLIASKVNATLIQGTYDKAPENKRRDLRSFDTATLIGIAARLNAAIYHSNPERRLPANTLFRVLYRIGVKSNDGGILSATVRTVWFGKRNPSGRVVQVEVDRKDPMFRLIRKSTKFITGAFANAKQPPKPERGGKRRNNDEGDDE